MPTGSVVARILQEAAPFGLYHTKPTADIKSRWAIKCSQCDTEYTLGWPFTNPPHVLTYKLDQQGWTTGRNVPPVCPSCTTPKAPHTMATDDVMNIDPKLGRKLYALLDEHFDDAKRLYRSGWSDAKIAKEVSVSTIHVEKLRRVAYGELAEDPVIQAMRDDLELIRMEATELQTKFMQGLSALMDKATAIEAKFPARKVL